MLDAIILWFGDRRLLSTLFAAAILSGTWTITWLFVFFLSTFILEFKTDQSAFILAFWLSIAAEALIRWAENTDLVARLGKPHEIAAQGDNLDFGLTKALLCLFAMVVFVSGYLFLAERIPEVFEFGDTPFGGQPTRDLAGFQGMLQNWWVGVTSPAVSISLGVGFLFRIVIYKRSHKL